MPDSRFADETLSRHDEARLRRAAAGHPRSFDGDGALRRPVAEARCFHLAHRFEPLPSVCTLLIDPLLHRIMNMDDNRCAGTVGCVLASSPVAISRSPHCYCNLLKRSTILVYDRDPGMPVKPLQGMSEVEGGAMDHETALAIPVGATERAPGCRLCHRALASA